MAPIAALLTVISVPTAASATTVPGPPSGWSTVFSDDFGGASGSGIDSQWIYDTGAGSSFGTGEIETMTNSTSNVHLDGNGHLDITALNNGGNWTSGRIQTTSANVGAPAGGELEVTASIQQPNGGLGYWPAFWMLGPGQWPENGEIDIMEDVNALSELSGTIHCGTDPGGPCNEGNGIGSGLRRLQRLPDRLPHVHDDPQPDQHLGRVDHLLPRRQPRTSASTRARSAPAPGRRRSTTTCRSSSTWPWAAPTRTACAAAPARPARPPPADDERGSTSRRTRPALDRVHVSGLISTNDCSTERGAPDGRALTTECSSIRRAPHVRYRGSAGGDADLAA
jgi:hypothetical protein